MITRRARPGLSAFAIVAAVTSLVTVCATIARTKVLARVVGPTGVGITAEVGQLVTLATTVAAIASGPALLTRIAAADRDGDTAKLRASVRAAIGLGLILAVLGGVAAVVVAPYVLPRATSYPARIFVVLSAVAALATVLNGVIQTLFVGTSNLRGIVLTTLAPTIVSTAIAIVLTLQHGLSGQFVALTVAAVLALVGSLLFLGSLRGPHRVSLLPRIDLGFVKEAMILGATGLIAGYLTQLVFTTVRETLEAVGGTENGALYNGNYQAAALVGTTYFTVVMGSLGTYFQPRFAAAISASELTEHVRAAERFVLRTAPPLVFAAVAFRADVIHLLYSDRFDIAIAILGYQLAGDVARGSAWVTAAPLLLRGKVLAFLVSESMGSGLSVGLNVWLIHSMGPMGSGVAYFITYVVYAFVSAAVLRATCGVPMAWRRLGVFLAVSLAAAGIELTTRRLPDLRWVVLPIVMVWGWRAGLAAPFIARLRRLTAPSDAAT